MRLDRSRRFEDDIWLGQKMLFFVLGAVIGVIGMATGRDWLIYLAIIVLAIGLVLRVVGRRGSRAEAVDEPVEEPPTAGWTQFDDARRDEGDAGPDAAERNTLGPQAAGPHAVDADAAGRDTAGPDEAQDEGPDEGPEERPDDGSERRRG